MMPAVAVRRSREKRMVAEAECLGCTEYGIIVCCVCLNQKSLGEDEEFW